jgi:hypothetical protein
MSSSASLIRLLCAAALCLAPLPAAGGTLVGASLSIEFADLAPIVFVGTGVSGSSSGPLSISVAAGNGFAGTINFPSPTSAAPPISGWIYSVGNNAAGVFSGATPSLVGGEMAIEFNVCAEAYGGLCLLDIDVPFGIAATVTPPVVSGIGITMHAAPWTAGTAAVGAETRVGSNGLNAKGAGALVMVSSVNVLTSIAGQLPAFATLTLQFVPEPAGAALTGLVAAALALGLGLRTRRRS